jgi:hypothetical protein
MATALREEIANRLQTNGLEQDEPAIRTSSIHSRKSLQTATPADSPTQAVTAGR